MSEDSHDPKLLAGRRGARYGAVQAVYSWLMNAVSVHDLVSEASGWSHLTRMDHEHFEAIVAGVVDGREDLDARIDPWLDRPLVQLDPMEHAVLLVAAWELVNCIELPMQVVINEAVELSKVFGANEAHRFINGVVDKMARAERPHEVAAGG